MSRLTAISSKDLGGDDTQAQAEQIAAARAQAAKEQQAATQMLLMALKALGQRFIVALASLFTLLTAGSAFYIWLIALPEITSLKIIAASLYSLFVLALNIAGRRA